MGVVKDFREAFKGVCPCLHARNTFEWCSRVGLGVIFLLVLPSQTVGMFTSHWVYSDNCSDLNLLYKDCGNATISGPNALGSSAFGLQVASYIVLLGTILVYIGILCCFYRSDEGEKENPIGKFCFPCFIPIGCLVSGIMNFVSCMEINNLPYDQRGYSYYLCLVSGVVLFSMGLIFFVGYFVHEYRNKCTCSNYICEE